MTDPTPYTVGVADDIAHRLGHLADLVSQAPPHEAAQALARVLDCDTGVLGRMTALLATGSHLAREHAEAGRVRPEVCLALGRAANDLNDVALDLDEHTDGLAQLAQTTAHGPVPKPVASAMVIRRRR
ncbi:hypothetical protein DMH15_40905 [Streptomyces sp. WAC 06725]|uniref:hypothetical protein n=1 Tax=Streptomyces sp. WAC 06725 TaxID=2203209 RepID=UPI000F7424E6|nr:hypothetical protein [Streptomyces sp. WAC 06725]RSO11403.1 hypothetical protein DMH15_40905 [Streptomyces sp. WAC 06725]